LAGKGQLPHYAIDWDLSVDRYSELKNCRRSVLFRGFAGREIDLGDGESLMGAYLPNLFKLDIERLNFYHAIKPFVESAPDRLLLDFLPQVTLNIRDRNLQDAQMRSYVYGETETYDELSYAYAEACVKRNSIPPDQRRFIFPHLALD
jgi:hypothetical protein